MKKIFKNSLLLLLLISLLAGCVKVSKDTKQFASLYTASDITISDSNNKVKKIKNEKSTNLVSEKLITQTKKVDPEINTNKNITPNTNLNPIENIEPTEPKVIEKSSENKSTDKQIDSIQDSSIKTEINIEEAKPKPQEVKFTNKTGNYWVKESLNMRSGAGTSHSIIRSLPKGSLVKSLALGSNGWYKISFNNKEGYVSGKYLSSSEIKPTPKPTPKPESKPESKPTPKPTPTSTKYAPMKMYLPGKTLSYKNGGISKGQGIIDSNHGIISTWGGAATYSGSDGMNTHFIGHNTNAFKGIGNYAIGTKITVTDSKGNATKYSVAQKYIVDDYGTDLNTGNDLYDVIASTGGGEVITLQTCKTSTTNWILRAKKIS